MARYDRAWLTWALAAGTLERTPGSAAAYALMERGLVPLPLYPHDHVDETGSSHLAGQPRARDWAWVPLSLLWDEIVKLGPCQHLGIRTGADVVALQLHSSMLSQFQDCLNGRQPFLALTARCPGSVMLLFTPSDHLGSWDAGGCRVASFLGFQPWCGPGGTPFQFDLAPSHVGPMPPQLRDYINCPPSEDLVPLPRLDEWAQQWLSAVRVPPVELVAQLLQLLAGVPIDLSTQARLRVTLEQWHGAGWVWPSPIPAVGPPMQVEELLQLLRQQCSFEQVASLEQCWSSFLAQDYATYRLAVHHQAQGHAMLLLQVLQGRYRSWQGSLAFLQVGPQRWVALDFAQQVEAVGQLLRRLLDPWFEQAVDGANAIVCGTLSRPWSDWGLVASYLERRTAIQKYRHARWYLSPNHVRQVAQDLNSRLRCSPPLGPYTVLQARPGRPHLID